jgi:hypothetical protein
LNKDFYRDISILSEDLGTLKLLGDISLDFELYLRFVSKIMDMPFSYLLTGVSTYESYKEVIDFVKPYRVRVVDMDMAIGFKDRVENTQIEGDDIDILEEVIIVDKACGNSDYFDKFTVRDELSILILP